MQIFLDNFLNPYKTKYNIFSSAKGNKYFGFLKPFLKNLEPLPNIGNMIFIVFQLIIICKRYINNPNKINWTVATDILKSYKSGEIIIKAYIHWFCIHAHVSISQHMFVFFLSSSWSLINNYKIFSLTQFYESLTQNRVLV